MYLSRQAARRRMKHRPGLRRRPARRCMRSRSGLLRRRKRPTRMSRRTRSSSGSICWIMPSRNWPWRCLDGPPEVRACQTGSKRQPATRTPTPGRTADRRMRSRLANDLRPAPTHPAPDAAEDDCGCVGVPLAPGTRSGGTTANSVARNEHVERAGFSISDLERTYSRMTQRSAACQAAAVGDHCREEISASKAK